MILKMLLSVLLLVTSAAVSAQQPGAEEVSATPDYASWRAVSAEMSPEEYTKVYRDNRRFLRQVVSSHTTAALVSLGVSENLIGVLGAAAALAFDNDARVKLNRAKTLAVEISDMTEEKRAIQIGYTLRW